MRRCSPPSRQDVEILETAAGVKQYHPFLTVYPALLDQTAQTSERSPAFRADEEPFTLPDGLDTPQDLFLAHCHGSPFTVTQGAEHQGVAHRTGHPQACSHGSSILPRLRTRGAGLKGPHDRSTTGSLHRDHAWSVRVDPPECLHLVKTFPHADQTCATTCGVDDHIRQFPIELLSELVAHGFLALHTVRLFERREVEPAVLVTACCHTSTGVGNQSVYQLDVRPVDLALDDKRPRHIPRHEHVGLQSSPRGIGRGSPTGVPRRWDGYLGHAQFGSARNGQRQATGLEGTRGVE